MEPLNNHLDKPLIWTQVEFRRFELRARDQVLARLEWRTALSSQAFGETAEGRWTLSRSGWFRPVIAASRAGGDIPAATLRRAGCGRNTIHLADGTSLAWKATRVHKGEVAIFGAANVPLITFRMRRKLLRYEAAVEISRAARCLPQLSVLILLGWYSIAQGLDEHSAPMVSMAGVATAYCGT